MAPTQNERNVFQRRRDLIDASHLPAGEARAEGLLGIIIGVLKWANETEEDAFTRRRAYVFVLRDLPAYAVQGACEAALRGDLGNARFVPQPGELRACAKRLMEPLLRERADVSRVLDASIEAPPKQTADERAAMLERVRASVRRVHEGAAQPMRYERQQMTEEDRRFATQKGGPDYRDGERKRLDAQAALDAMSYRDAPCQLSDEAIEKFNQGSTGAQPQRGVADTGRRMPQDTGCPNTAKDQHCRNKLEEDKGRAFDQYGDSRDR